LPGSPAAGGATGGGGRPPAAAAAATPSRRKLSQARAPRVKKVDWRVTLGVVAPDCFERPALLVSGQLGPTLEVTQGDFLEVL
jgi:hypothetical protein